MALAFTSSASIGCMFRFACDRMQGRTPELTGKWSGNSDLSTQMARAPGSLQMQNAKAVPVQVTMTLNQNGGESRETRP